MLISHGHKPLPVGTRSKAAARKLNKMNLGFRHSLQELHQLNRADQKEVFRGFAKDYKMKGVQEAAEEIKERRSKKAELLNNVAAKRIQKNYRLSKSKGDPPGLPPPLPPPASAPAPAPAPAPKPASKLKSALKPSNDLSAAFESVSDQKEEEESKKRQALIKANQPSDLPHRTVSSSGGVGKMPEEGQAVIPKGQELVNEFIEIVNTDPAKASEIRTALQIEFNDDDLNRMVKNSPVKLTQKQSKEIKGILRSESAIGGPTPSPAKSGKGKSELGSNEKTPAPPPLTIEKIHELSSSYKKGEKLTEKDRETLSLFGHKIRANAAKDALTIFEEILQNSDQNTKDIIATGQKLNSDINKTMALPRAEEPIKPGKSAAGGGGPSKTVNTKRGTGANWGTVGWTARK